MGGSVFEGDELFGVLVGGAGVRHFWVGLRAGG